MNHTLRNRITLLALVAVAPLVTPPATRAAEARPAPSTDVLGGAARGTWLRDDDGGKVQIVPRRPVAQRAPIDHGGPIVTRETVHLVFVGAAWRDGAHRALEGKIADVLFASHRPGTQMEDPLDPTEGASMSDLDVQRRLAPLVEEDRSGELGKPGAVFVVFLAPGLESTLGQRSSRSDYAAYHNFVHLAPGVTRYVVVPFDAEFARWSSAARESLLQTLLNPEGTGIY
jgi:hypothetical protein